ALDRDDGKSGGGGRHPVRSVRRNGRRPTRNSPVDWFGCWRAKHERRFARGHQARGTTDAAGSGRGARQSSPYAFDCRRGAGPRRGVPRHASGLIGSRRMSAAINRDPLRVALIGYGHGGSVFHAPLIVATPGLELAAIVTGSPDRSGRARHAFPDTSILASADLVWDNAAHYDLVVVSTPNRSHVPLGLAALEAGLGVVVDKPLATSVAEAERLVAASRRLDRLLTAFHNARWANTFLTTREVIASGMLGQITRYEARMDRYRPQSHPGAWRELAEPNEGGGLLLDLGTHLIDQAVQLFGWPRRVYAEVEHRRPGSHVDDDTFVALEFSELRAHLWMSYVARLPGPAVRLHGLT